MSKVSLRYPELMSVISNLNEQIGHCERMLKEKNCNYEQLATAAMSFHKAKRKLEGLLDKALIDIDLDDVAFEGCIVEMFNEQN